MAISTRNMKGFFYSTGLSKYKSPSVQIEDGSEDPEVYWGRAVNYWGNDRVPALAAAVSIGKENFLCFPPFRLYSTLHTLNAHVKGGSDVGNLGVYHRSGAKLL